MKVIKTEKELNEVLFEDTPMPPSVMNTTGYRNFRL